MSPNLFCKLACFNAFRMNLYNVCSYYPKCKQLNNYPTKQPCSYTGRKDFYYNSRDCNCKIICKETQSHMNDRIPLQLPSLLNKKKT